MAKLPKNQPKKLTLGIHLAWLTLGLGGQASLADTDIKRIARQPAKPVISSNTTLNSADIAKPNTQKPTAHKKSPTLSAILPKSNSETDTADLSDLAIKPTGTVLDLIMDDFTAEDIRSDPNELLAKTAPKSAEPTTVPDPVLSTKQTTITRTSKPKLSDVPLDTVSADGDDIRADIDKLIANKSQENREQSLEKPAPTELIARQSATAEPFYPKTTNNTLTALASFYQTSPSTAGCQGTWHYPYPTASTDGLTASANYGYYNAKNLAELSGNVIINQNRHQIRAGKITLNPLTGQSYATGNVLFGSGATTDELTPTNIRLNKLPQSDLMGLAQSLNYNTKTGHATAKEVAFASRALHAHGYAKALQHKDDTSYQLEDVIFSTCPPTNRLWHLHAKNIELNTKTGRGTTTHTTLNIKDIPVFYLPYFNFPIDDRRQTGFLTPNAGLNSKDGLQVSTPYYLNLAPNYDATLTPTVYTNRNPRLSGEFRYLTRQFGSGVLDGAYLPNDKQYQHKNRQHLFFDHDYRPFDDKNFIISGTYRYVSDSSYLTDFDKLGLDNNPLNLPRRIKADYHNEHLSFNARAETFQKLAGTDRLGNPILDKDRPYARLPQLSLTYQVPSDQLRQYAPLESHADNLSITGTHDLAYFKKSINDNSALEKSGVRLYNQLSASYLLLKSWGYLTPTAKLTHLYTVYDENSTQQHNLNDKNNSHNVFLPSVSLDTGLFFEKKGSPFVWNKGQGGYQLLSPRLKYLYTPYKDQTDLPNFDTTPASISYDQLLSDSWFLGYDRISDLHALTPALNYRYVDGTGATRLDASIAKQFYLDSPQVGLEGKINETLKSSALAWQVSTQPHSHLWLTLAGTLKHNTPSSFIGMVNYQPYANMQFGFGVVERKADTALRQLPLSAYTASVIYPLNPRWQLMATTQYDANYRQFMDTLVGLNYEDCCIGVSVYGRRLRNELMPTEKPDHTIMAELRLNGLAGSNKFSRLLKERIVGYK